MVLECLKEVAETNEDYRVDSRPCLLVAKYNMFSPNANPLQILLRPCQDSARQLILRKTRGFLS